MTTNDTTIVQQLEEDIVLGLLRPCERLTEDELMARFGAKRHVIRDALSDLVQLGLVERKKNVGAYVRSFTYAAIMDLYALRDLLEGEAARLMPCPATSADINRLKVLQRHHDAAVSQGDLRAIFRANMAFHEGFFSLCPNQVLVDAIRFYAVQTHAIRSSSAHNTVAQQRSVVEHNAIINALEMGSCESLIQLCQQHILPARDEYLATHRHLFIEQDHLKGKNQ